MSKCPLIGPLKPAQSCSPLHTVKFKYIYGRGLGSNCYGQIVDVSTRLQNAHNDLVPNAKINKNVWKTTFLIFWKYNISHFGQKGSFEIFRSRILADHPALQSTRKGAHWNGSMTRFIFSQLYDTRAKLWPNTYLFLLISAKSGFLIFLKYVFNI